MHLKQPVDRSGRDPALPRSRIGQNIPGEVPEVLAKPLRRGTPNPIFRRERISAGSCGRILFQNVLSNPVSKLQPGRNRRGVLHQHMVKRGTRASSDVSIVVRSTLVRMSSGRYCRTSRYCSVDT